MENVYFKGVERRNNTGNAVWYATSGELVTTLANVTDYLLFDWCKFYRLTEKYSHVQQICETFSWLRDLEDNISNSDEDIPAFIPHQVNDCVVSAYDSIAEALVLLDVEDLRPLVARACCVQVHDFLLQRITKEEYLKRLTKEEYLSRED